MECSHNLPEDNVTKFRSQENPFAYSAYITPDAVPGKVRIYRRNFIKYETVWRHDVAKIKSPLSEKSQNTGLFFI